MSPASTGVNLAGRNQVCAFFHTIDEEHRVLGSLCGTTGSTRMQYSLQSKN